MRFIDEAKIRVAGGHGGAGCVSFRRETFVPRGGPDGGDGGKGGDIAFRSTAQLSTLQDFRYRRVYAGEAGKHGQGSNKAGRDGEGTLIFVPVGTVISDSTSGEVLIDFTTENKEWVACKGGRGGKGNAHFVTSTFQAPKFAQPGEEGESRELMLELKLLADVGIIGFPNSGKSTLISRISAARPKIADYPFTTLTPNLGVVSRPDFRSYVVADFPGLIEGAHRGEGLGHGFLRHIERARVFVHLIDGMRFLEEATRPDQRDRGLKKLVDTYQAIRNELGLFNEKLLHRPEIVVINKLDLFQMDTELVQNARKVLHDHIASIRGTHPLPNEPLVISAETGIGLEELLSTIDSELLEQRKRNQKTTVLLPDDESLRA